MKSTCIRPLILGVAVISAILTACVKDEDNRPLITVSVPPQQYLVEQIAGDRYRTVTLIPNGENPETFDPSVADRMAVGRSRIFFITGFYPFEKNASLSVPEGTQVINTSDGISLIYGTHSHSDGHTTFLHVDSAHRAPDPHVWTSVRNVRRMAAIVAEGIIADDPDNAQTYRDNLLRLDSRLDSLDRAIVSRLDSLPTRTFLVWHPSLSYFASDYGLEQLAVSSDSRESSMPEMRRIIDEAREDSVRVFFFQHEYDSRQARAINSGVGSRMVAVSPTSYGWLCQLDSIANELSCN